MECAVVGCLVENLTAHLVGRRVTVWVEDADDVGGTLDVVTSEGIRLVSDSGQMAVPWGRVVAIVQIDDDDHQSGGQWC